jgi:hypothetical protein
MHHTSRLLTSALAALLIIPQIAISQLDPTHPLSPPSPPSLPKPPSNPSDLIPGTGGSSVAPPIPDPVTKKVQKALENAGNAALPMKTYCGKWREKADATAKVHKESFHSRVGAGEVKLRLDLEVGDANVFWVKSGGCESHPAYSSDREHGFHTMVNSGVVWAAGHRPCTASVHDRSRARQAAAIVLDSDLISFIGFNRSAV